MAKLKRESKKPEMNLTSMMDVVFQLIIFFILVSNFTTADLPPLEAPDPERSVAEEMPEENMLIVNVLREEPGGPLEVRSAVGQTIPATDNYRRLTEIIQARLAENEELKVNLRADRSLRFDEVEPVMRAIMSASTEQLPLKRIHLVAKMDQARR